MEYDLFFLANLYSRYLSGDLPKDQMFTIAAHQLTDVWKSDAAILLLDIEFDNEAFPNPETEMAYRLLNLEVARYIASDTAIANTAYSASKVAVNKLRDFGMSLKLMFESANAYLRFGNLNAATMNVRNIAKFYKVRIANENYTYLKAEFNEFLSLISNMAGGVPSSQELTDSLQIMLDCLENLLSFKYDEPLCTNTVNIIESMVLPNLKKEDKAKFLMRLGNLIE